MRGKVQVAVSIGALVMVLGMRDVRAEGGPVNIQGSITEPMTATGEVASAYSSDGAICQLRGTGIPIVIRGLVLSKFDGPNPVAGSGAWFLVMEGKLTDVFVDGAPLVLADQVISNGLIRTKEFGDCRIYSYNGSRLSAMVVPQDQLHALQKRVDARTNATHAEQQSGGSSPPAVRPPKPTP